MSRDVVLSNGERVSALGQGTWTVGEKPARRQEEAGALQLGLDLGLTLIDTAEMYGDGATESFLGEVLGARREQVFLVSKVLPHNAGRDRLIQACEASLRRLRTNRLDMYLLHWRGSVPLAETIDGMERLVRAGKIRSWGVSNFDSGDMAELAAAGGSACAVNQILYNVARRGPEFDLIDDLARRRVALMAYSPVEQGRLPAGGALDGIAAACGVTRYQVALAWVLRQPGSIAIPKAGSREHVQANAGALALALTPEQLSSIDAEYPPPGVKRPLEML